MKKIPLSLFLASFVLVGCFYANEQQSLCDKGDTTSCILSKKSDTFNELRTPFILMHDLNILGSIILSPDTKYAAGYSNERTIVIFNNITRSEIRTLYSYPYEPVGFLNSTQILTSNGSVYDITTGKRVKQYEGFNGSIVMLSKDQNYAVVSQNYGEGSYMYQILNLKTAKMMSPEADCYHGFLNDNKTVLRARKISESLGILDVVNIQNNKVIQQIDFKFYGSDEKSHVFTPNKSRYILISPAMKTVATGTAETQKESLVLISLKTGKYVKTLCKQEGTPDRIALSPNDRYLLREDSYYNESQENIQYVLSLWDIETGEKINSIEIENQLTIANVFQKFEKTPLSFEEIQNLDSETSVLSQETHKINENNKFQYSNILSYFKESNKRDSYFSDDKKYKILFKDLGNDTQALEIIDNHTNQEINSFGFEHLPYSSLKISSDNKYIFVTSGFKVVIIDFSTGKIVHKFDNEAIGIEEIGELSLLKDNRHGLIGDTAAGEGCNYSNDIKLINLFTNEVVKKYKNDDIDCDIRTILPSNNEKSLLFIGYYQLKLVDIKTGKKLWLLNDFPRSDNVHFSQNDKYILIANESVLKIIDTKTGKLALTVRFSDTEWAAITPDGYFSASEGRNEEPSSGFDLINILKSPMEAVPLNEATKSKYYKPELIQKILEEAN